MNRIFHSVRLKSTVFLVLIGLSAYSGLTSTEKKALSFAKVNMDDLLLRVHREQGVSIVAECYSMPRPRVAMTNKLGRGVRVEYENASDLIEWIAHTFQYSISRCENIVVLNNSLQEFDEEFRVPDALLGQLTKYPPNGTFRSFLPLLHLSVSQLRAVAEQFPCCEMILPRSDRRQQAELFALLAPKVQSLLCAGKSVPVTKLASAASDKTKLSNSRFLRTISEQDRANYVAVIKRDERGWEYLQLISLRRAAGYSRRDHSGRLHRWKGSPTGARVAEAMRKVSGSK